MGQTHQPAYFSSVLSTPACQQGLSKVGQDFWCLLQFQILPLPDSQAVINGAVWWLGNCWDLRPCLAQHAGTWSRRDAKALHYEMQVFICIKMIAAGSQSESPGGSAKVDTLSVTGLPLLSSASPVLVRAGPDVRDGGRHIWGCRVDWMQIRTHGLRQSLTFPPVNYSADVYKCLCNL